MLAEVAVNVLFALLYLVQPGAVANARPGAFADAFFFSLETLATVGYGTMSPGTTYGHVVSAFEILTGMALTAVLTGLLFVRFSRPKSKVLYSTRAVVAMHNGQPTLMLRLGNGRLTLLTQMKARLGILLSEETSEGQVFRRVHDLALRSADMQVFVLTWTLMHAIDASSPLHGYDSGRLVREDVRLFLSIDGRDHRWARKSRRCGCMAPTTSSSGSGSLTPSRATPRAIRRLTSRGWMGWSLTRPGRDRLARTPAPYWAGLTAMGAGPQHLRPILQDR